MILWLYRLFFLPVLLTLAPRYLARMRRRGGYRAGFAQRLGHCPALAQRQPGQKRVWVQAVSVGEMLAVAPVLEALQHDGVQVYLTTTTSTGRRVADERYASIVAGIGYFPLDWWLFSARAWARIAPDLAILVEGERWPEHLRQAVRRRVPVLAINARVSDRSFARLRRVPSLARWMLGAETRFLAASQLDEDRLLELGVDRDRLRVTGNIKLDLRLRSAPPGELARLQAELGLDDGLVLLGSSTWPGEEEALVAAWRRGRQAGIRCSLLLVPRHAERRGEIEALLRREKVRYHLRSRGPAEGKVEVALADTTGELRRLTQVADVVFVGKSLPPHAEGQTPVEAAALGKALIMGSGMSNFRTIARELLARGGALQVSDPAALAEATTDLLRDAGRRASLGAAAATWQRENAGAIDRTLAAIRAELAAGK